MEGRGMWRSDIDTWGLELTL